MARFDVYKNPDGEGYLLDVQADLVSHLNTRVVIPLLPVSVAPQPAAILNPCLAITGDPHIMTTQFMAAVPTSILRTPITRLQAKRDEIVAAVDFVLQGF